MGVCHLYPHHKHFPLFSMRMEMLMHGDVFNERLAINDMTSCNDVYN